MASAYEHGVVRNYLVIHIIARNACRSGNIEGLSVKRVLHAKLEKINGIGLYKIKV